MKELEELKKVLSEMCGSFKFDSKKFKAFASIYGEVNRQIEKLEHGS